MMHTTMWRRFIAHNYYKHAMIEADWTLRRCFSEERIMDFICSDAVDFELLLVRRDLIITYCAGGEL